jgi:CheY-like chemotaxis protein
MILKGWKDIAKYLGCGIRTAQRWEALLGLPVRRPSRGPGSAILALTQDVDAWLRSESWIRDTPERDSDLSSKFQHRILIADGNEKLLVSLATLLIRERYEVRTARDGFEALSVMRDSLPDLLISDLRMLNMSGFELLGVVRRRFPAVSVLVHSGEFTPTMISDVLCELYIKKGPNSRTKLLAAVRNLLSHSPMRAQPAKVERAAVWLPISTTGYIVLTCTDCLRSFPLLRRSAVIGKDATTACDYCGTEVRYHISESNLPIVDDLSKLSQHLRQRGHPESEN